MKSASPSARYLRWSYIISLLLFFTLPLSASGTFSISASPSSLAVAQASQGTSTITTTASGGFNNSISLSATGVPVGVSVAFNPPSIGAPGNGSSIMTITVVKVARLGTYPITVAGNGGGIKKTVVVTLTVTGQGTFTISASPSTVSIAPGNQDTSTITTTISNGFSGSITLSATGAPSGTNVSFNPTTIPAPGAGSSTMTITVGSNTPLGTYPITVTGNGSGIQQTTIVTLIVTAAPSFAISASPSSLSVAQGNQGTSTITTTISNGFNSSISLSLSGVPSGTNVNMSPWTIPAPGAGSSTMTITVGSGTAPGAYPITVTGNGGGVQQSTTVILTVTPAPNFTISAAPTVLTVAQGHQGTSTITTVINSSFNSAISLSASGAPSGTNVAFNPQTIPAPGAGSSVMTVTVGNNTPVGSYPITVTGNGGGVQQSVTVTLTVAQPNFSITAAPSTLTVQQGDQGISTITTTISGGFNSSISLSASGMPTGTNVTFSPPTIPAPGAGSSAMTISVGSTTPVGSYPITVGGSGGGIQQYVTVNLTVTEQGQQTFTLAAAPDTLTIGQGTQGTSTLTTTISDGFNSPIYLSATGQPPGVAVSFNPSTIPAPGSGSSTMTVNALKIAKAGTYPITVKGSGGGIQQFATVTVTVVTAQNFSLSASPGTLTVIQTSQGTSTISSVVSGGFNSAVSFSASGVPSGTAVTFNPNSLPAPGSGNSTASINVGMSTLPGYYSISVVGNGGGLQRNTTIGLTVTPAPNFVIAASPSVVSAAQGNVANSILTTTICCGFNSSIALSATGVPSGTNVTFSPNNISAPGAGHSTMTITVGSTTPTGIYPIVVTGAGGGLQYPATVTLTVTGGTAPTSANFQEPYSYSLQSGFGMPPYRYQLTSGALPPGLVMNGSGNISGTATAVGQYNFSVLATDSSQPAQQQSSSYTLNVVIGLDDYSGLTAAPVPGCNKNGFFQLLKVDGRWLFATPECNTFYQLSLYFADPYFIRKQIMSDHYGNDKAKWATHTLNRMETYGYNSVDIFYSTYMLPVGTWGYHDGASIKVPFALYNPALVDVRQNIQNAGISEPIKDICAGRDGSGLVGYCGFTLDIFDPKWQVANTNELANLSQNVFTDGFADSPWVIGISLGDSGNLVNLTGNGNGHDGVATYPHPGMVVATVNFQQTTYSGGTYEDTNVYSKYAWVSYLQSKYGSIAALNSAWNTGGFYTAFGDAGGFGTGTGVLDEDGRHTQWFGKDYYNLKNMNSNLQTDVNQFLYDFTVQAYGVQANTFRTYDTNHLFICGTFGGLGEGGVRPQVLQGLRDSGCNVQVWNWDANYVQSSLTVNQGMYDVVGTPAIIMYATTAQKDSDMSAYPNNGSFDGDYPTQEDRGQQYGSDQAALLQAQGTNGDYYMVGSTAWGLTDDSFELKNWGIISLTDNVYDGTCPTVLANIDQWGYPCGGEAANYGDYTTAITQTNSTTLQQLILQILNWSK